MRLPVIAGHPSSRTCSAGTTAKARNFSSAHRVQGYPCRNSRRRRFTPRSTTARGNSIPHRTPAKLDEEKIRLLTAELAQKEQEFAGKHQLLLEKVDYLQNALNQITSSRAFALTEFLWNMRKKFLPRRG